MSEIFDESRMKQFLERCIPAGESFLAGIHAISKETCITGVFGNCIREQDRLIPKENGGIVVLNKKKYSACDIYIGMTQSFLVMADCERESYYYEFDEETDLRNVTVRELHSELFLTDIGTCYPLEDIENCEIKNGMMGSVKCFITMKDGSYFKLMFPKRGGLGGGMPHHAEWRDALIARLSGGKA